MNGQDTGSITKGATKINTVVESKENIGNIATGKSKTQEILLESNGKLTSTGTLEFPGYIAQIKTAYLNPMGRKDEYSIPDSMYYAKEDNNSEGINQRYINMPNNKDYNLEILNYEDDEFWVETIEITESQGGDKQTIVILITSITAGLAILAGGIFAIKKYVL